MIHPLYSIGYRNAGALALLQERVDHGTLILDIRLRAASRYRPAFSSKRLRERFGEAYQHIPELGNSNYAQPHAPICLRDPERGLPRLLAYLEQQACCLLCGCQQFATCHTSVVIDALRRVQPDLQVTRLGEQPSQARYPTCLSIRQPWTWLLTHPEEVAACGMESKTIENRNWRPLYRGPLLLHAGATVETTFFDRRSGLLLPDYWIEQFGAAGERLAQIMPQHRSDYPTGAIVVMADLVDVVDESTSPWFVGRYGMVLAHARAMTPLINYPGQRMLFEVPDIPILNLREEME